MRVSTIQAGFSIVLTLSLGVGLLTSGSAQSFRWLGGLSYDRLETSNAYDVSADGRVVVGVAFFGDPVRWENGVMQLLPMLSPSDHGGAALGVSADGRVVVGYIYPHPHLIVPFRWTLETGTQPIPGLVNRYGAAFDVSADGSAIVGYATLGRYDLSAYRWTPQTGVWNLSVLLGSFNGGALAITPDGRVFVGYDRIDDQGRRATLWTAQGQTLVLGTLPDAGESFATGVSPDGTVVVGFTERYINYQFIRRPFRWTQQTGIQDLGLLPGGESGQANDVAENGVVVGSIDQPFESRCAFMWTESAGLQDLNVVYASALPFGVNLITAEAISPDGRYIVGQAYNPRFGREEAYILDTWPRGEVTGNGCINNADLLRVLFAFGTPGTGHARHEDINKDGTVNNTDLLIVLFNFGHGCQ